MTALVLGAGAWGSALALKLAAAGEPVRVQFVWRNLGEHEIHLARNHGVPVGLKTIAATVGEAEDTIEEVFEPHLLRCGFLQKTGRGRTVTIAGATAIGVELSDSSGAGRKSLRVTRDAIVESCTDRDQKVAVLDSIVGRC